MANKEMEFLNFLKKYDLDEYHNALTEVGVKKISHLQHVQEEDLEKVGMSKSEQQRLRGKYEKHFSKFGKLKDALTGKKNKFSCSANAMQAMEKANVDAGAMLLDEKDIHLLHKIGEGAHGVVYEGKWETHGGEQKVAVKVLNDNDDTAFLMEFLKEASVMTKLQHSNVIRMYGIILSPTRLVEEFAPLGDLLSYLKVNGESLTVALTHSYALQIANAMRYLEEMRLIHRDLAARNILVYTKDKLKLSDFGMARLLDNFDDIYKLSNLASRVPIAWSALEVLTEAKFSTASDVWSYGVTLWEVYSLGAAPWKGLNPVEIRDKLVAGERLSRPKRCHHRVYNLMLQCWVQTSRDRPKFHALHHDLEQICYEKLMAIKECTPDDDQAMLCYKPHDIITVIDKHSDEWWTGVHDRDGRFGHFQVSHFSRDIPPDNTKAPVKSKKKTACNAVIGNPVDVVHKAHVGTDGTKWSSESVSDMLSPTLTHHQNINAAVGYPHIASPTGDLFQLDEEMRNLSPHSPGPHYDVPRSFSKNEKSKSSSVLQHPVPKPRKNVSQRAASFDIAEGSSHPMLKHTVPAHDPAALVVASNPDRYITSNQGWQYQNLRYETAGNWLSAGEDLGRNESTGELVIQPGRRAEAYARTSFTPHVQMQSNGAAAVTSYEQKQTVLPPSGHSGTDIRYPPQLPEFKDHLYEMLREVPENEYKSRSLPREASPCASPKQRRHTTVSSPSLSARRQYAQLADNIQKSVPQATFENCLDYLTKHKGDMELAIQDIKVHILVEMGLESGSLDNCRKALGHCQWKLDRAAEWLIEQS